MTHKNLLSVLFVALLLVAASAVYAQDGGDVNIIEYGNTEFGTLSVSSPSEAWQFEGFAADSISVSVNQIMGDLDPYVVILDPMGRVMATDDNSGEAYPNALVRDFRLPDSGTYTILVQGYMDTTGDYEVTVARNETGMIYGQIGGGGELPYDIPMIDGLSQQSSSDKWTFEGLPGDVVSLTMKRLSGTLAPYLLLLGPDGAVVKFTDYPSPDEAYLDSVSLTAPGTHTVIAQRAPGSNTAGDYELRLTRTAEGFTPVDDGDGPIQYGDMVAGALWNEHSSNTYTFEGVPGETLQVTVSRVDGNLEPSVLLLDPDGGSISIYNNSGDATIYDTEVRLQKAGQYSLEVSSSYSTFGNYELALELVSGGISHKPGGGELEHGQSAEGAIWLDNPADEYAFEAVPGDQIHVEVVRESGDLEPSILLIGPDKRSITLYDEDSSAETYSGTTTLDMNGTYRLAVIPLYPGSQAGDYQITLSLLQPGITHTAEGGDLEYDTIVQAALWNENRRDEWLFEAQSGDTVNILVTPTSGDLAPSLQVFGPDGQLVNSGNTNLTAYPLTMTGDYTLVVGLWSGTYGDYDLVVEHVQSLVAPADGVLPPGERVISAISSDNMVDTWTFDGQQDDHIVIEMSLISGNLSPYLVLLKPNGTVAVVSDSYYASDTSVVLDVVLPVTGTYQLLAQSSPAYLNGLGNYALMVSIIQTADGRIIPSGGGQLLLGESVVGEITNDDPQDVYRVILTEPVVIDIALTRSEGNLNGYLEVMNDQGDVLTSDDDSAGGFNPVIKALELEPGEYSIVASRPDGDKLSEGVYSLDLTRAE